jgi:hypothetical protein
MELEGFRADLSQPARPAAAGLPAPPTTGAMTMFLLRCHAA